jgi:hypothetical protein
LQLSGWGEREWLVLRHPKFRRRRHFFAALTFAHRAFWAAAIRRRADVDNVLLPRLAPFLELNASEGLSRGVDTISFLLKLLNNAIEVCHGGHSSTLADNDSFWVRHLKKHPGESKFLLWWRISLWSVFSSSTSTLAKCSSPSPLDEPHQAGRFSTAPVQCEPQARSQK